MSEKKKSGEASRNEAELMDQLLAGCEGAEDVFGPGGAFNQLRKRLIERMLHTELSSHLGYEKGQKAPDSVAAEGNHRNGYSSKKVISEDGPLELAIPRDRLGTFEPQLIRKGQRRSDAFDRRIISLYARGMTVREIQGFLVDQYGLEVSPDFISAATEGVMDEVTAWQNRPLETLYPIVVFDALRVKIRDQGTVQNKAVHLALGIRTDGQKEVLGLWIETNEGAKFWLKVLTDLRNRGVQDVLIAVVDGLKGFPEAIQTVFPKAEVQTCIVHLVRHSLNFCGWQDRRLVAAELRGIYRAATAEEALRLLEAFAGGKWGRKYANIVAAWRRAWEQVIPFFAYPMEVRRVIYTTNAIESLNMQLRKIIKNRGHFPNDEAASKLIFLALRNITADWKMPPVFWKSALNQFVIRYPERFTASSL
jgi:transposase-like protein